MNRAKLLAIVVFLMARVVARAQYASFPAEEVLLAVGARPSRIAAVLPFPFETVECSPLRCTVAIRPSDAEAAERLLSLADLDVSGIGDSFVNTQQQEREDDFVAVGDVASDCGDFSQYHSHGRMTACLGALEAEYPESVQLLESIGKSVQERDIWHIVLASGGAFANTTAVPDVVVYGNMHGDETVGREVSLRLAHELVAEFASGTARIVSLLESTRVHILRPCHATKREKVSVSSSLHRPCLV